MTYYQQWLTIKLSLKTSIDKFYKKYNSCF